MKTRKQLYSDMRAALSVEARAVLLVLGVFIAALGLSASAAAHNGGRAATTGSVTFTDPAGDAGTSSPDITSVTINGDPGTGTITVAVTATAYLPASPDGLERDINVFLDTDKNGSTGSISGSEYVLDAWNDSTGAWWDMGRWDGSAWKSVPQSATMSFTRSGDVLTWTLNAADLGGATGFALYASAGTYDAGNNAVDRDFAPDSGKWTYDLSAGAPSPSTTTTTTTTTTSAPTRDLTMFLTPEIGKPATVPVRAVAGKRLTFSFHVNRSDDHKPLMSGKMIGASSVAGKVVPHTQSFSRGVARLSLVVPKSAKGKQLKVKLTITAPSYKGTDGTYVDVATGQTGTIHTSYSGQSATRNVSLVIR
jgi:hypothetical protein